MSRRHFLGHLATTGHGRSRPCSSSARSRPTPSRSARANKSCILLWMAGGPSHMDTWDLKPDSEKNGGPFKPIATSARGVQISEHLPTVAKQMQHLSIIRSLELQGGQPRPRHLHDAHRVRPQPDRRPSRLRLGLLATSWASKLRELRPAALHRDQLARARGPASWGWRTRRSWSRTRTRRSPTSSRPRGSTTMRMDRRLQMLGLVENSFIAPAARPGGRRPQGGLRQDGPDDELAVHATPSSSTTSPPPSATPTAAARSARAA